MPLHPQTSMILGLILLAIVTYSLWLRSRRLERRLERVIKGLLQLVDESETATNELRQSLAALAQEGSHTAKRESLPADSEDAEGPSSEPWDIDRRHHILTLARRGLSPTQIASRLCIPDGEVELLLRLARQPAA